MMRKIVSGSCPLTDVTVAAKIQTELDNKLPKIDHKHMVHTVRLLERSYAELMPKRHEISSKKPLERIATLGIGGFSALDAAVFHKQLGQADITILADINEDQVSLFKEMKESIATAADFNEFIDKYSQLQVEKAATSRVFLKAGYVTQQFCEIKSEDEKAKTYASIKQFVLEAYTFDSAIHLCWKPENFERLKEVFLSSVIIQLDLSDPDSAKHVGDALKRHDVTLSGGMYLSNVPYFLRPGDQDFAALKQAGKLLELKGSIQHLCQHGEPLIMTAIDDQVSGTWPTAFWSVSELLKRIDTYIEDEAGSKKFNSFFESINPLPKR